MVYKRPWWTQERVVSSAWLVLFLPALACYTYFLSVHLNQYPEVEGSLVERLHPRLGQIIPVGAKVEMIADGFGSTGGTQWVHDQESDRDYLIFSDTLHNRIWKWEEGGGMFTLGKSLFLDRSGCEAGSSCSEVSHPGSHDLFVDHESGEVFICEHGNRRVTRLEKNGTRTALATHFNGHRLNGPKGLAFSARGDLYFTDASPAADTPDQGDRRPLASGLYRVSKEVLEAVKAEDVVAPDPELLEGGFSRTSGLGFSREFNKLYLAVEGDRGPAWNVYDVVEGGGLSNGRVFVDGNPLMEWSQRREPPEGLGVDDQDNVFATGPGGVWVFSPDGSRLGVVDPGVPVADVAIARDGYLYMAAADAIMRIKVSTKAGGVPS